LLYGLWLSPDPWFLCWLMVLFVAAGSGHVVALPYPCLSANDELQWANSNIVWPLAVV